MEQDNIVTIFFTVKGEQVADYHYFFYDEIAALISYRWPKKVADAWHGLLREELSSEMHGEVDERSWRLKQALLRRPMNARRDGKPFREYARQSFEDTMTLYLHGICCDIDVDTGPATTPQPLSAQTSGTAEDAFPAASGPRRFSRRFEKPVNGVIEISTMVHGNLTTLTGKLLVV